MLIRFGMTEYTICSVYVILIIFFLLLSDFFSDTMRLFVYGFSSVLGTVSGIVNFVLWCMALSISTKKTGKICGFMDGDQSDLSLDEVTDLKLDWTMRNTFNLLHKGGACYFGLLLVFSCIQCCWTLTYDVVRECIFELRQKCYGLD
jgi:hypothetical protein